MSRLEWARRVPCRRSTAGPAYEIPRKLAPKQLPALEAPPRAQVVPGGDGASGYGWSARPPLPRPVVENGVNRPRRAARLAADVRVAHSIRPQGLDLGPERVGDGDASHGCFCKTEKIRVTRRNPVTTAINATRLNIDRR